MGSEWQDLTLGDFVTLQRGHDLPEPKRMPGNVPILGSFGITGWHNEAKTNGPGVTVGRSGASFGVVTYSPVDYWPLNTALYVKDFHGNDPKFAYYFLQSLDFHSYNSGSAQPSLNRNHIHPISITIPSVEEQQAIAHILGSLDDKIDLNRRMNATLEAMAQALFKSWFVDFDPVIDNALAAGHPIPEPLQSRAEARAVLGDQRKPLPEAIQQQFPSRFVFNEDMGWVPEGWEVQLLKSLTSKIGSGATPRGGGKVYVEEGTSLIRSQNVYDSRFVWDGLVRITEKTATQLKGVTVCRHDVLINITGASILRTCVVDPEVLPARVNQHVAIIRARNQIPSRFIHLYLLQERIKSLLLGQNAGASREAVTKGHLESVAILVPQEALLQQFKQLSDPVYEKGEKLSREARTLTKLRDTLLPKLLSGQIRIPDAEKQVAEVL